MLFIYIFYLLLRIKQYYSFFIFKVAFCFSWNLQLLSGFCFGCQKKCFLIFRLHYITLCIYPHLRPCLLILESGVGGGERERDIDVRVKY